ncbi:hypothetical protein HYS48_04435 [Candidatus Woesearchaeota archaeon]|nr:hypothetical protein [Candidatus Woesearchaeota archaeon]
MKGLVLTNPGIEDSTALEIKELLRAKTEIKEALVLFDAKKLEDFCRLCYKAQSVKRILLMLGEGKVKNLEDFESIMEKISVEPYLTKQTSFAVRAIRVGEHDFSSHDIEETVGTCIEGKVDLQQPAITIIVYLHGQQCYIGIDMAGFDLSKREYRIFTNSNLKATVAYAMLRIADIQQKQTILDLFCKDGQIGIEAGLYLSHFPVQYYQKEKFAFRKFSWLDFDVEKLFAAEDRKMLEKIPGKIICSDPSHPHVKAAEKNAKIAGIHKLLQFSRMDVEWLDTKFKKKSVEVVVSFPPQPSGRVNIKDVEKHYQETFYQLDYILKPKGKAVFIGNDLLKDIAAKRNFKVTEERKIRQGGKEFTVMLFTRG